jgi:hypothetical protein
VPRCTPAKWAGSSVRHAQRPSATATFQIGATSLVKNVDFGMLNIQEGRRVARSYLLVHRGRDETRRSGREVPRGARSVFLGGGPEGGLIHLGEFGQRNSTVIQLHKRSECQRACAVRAGRRTNSSISLICSGVKSSPMVAFRPLLARRVLMTSLSSALKRAAAEGEIPLFDVEKVTDHLSRRAP